MARLAQVILGNGSKLYWRATDVNGNGTGSFVPIPSVLKISLPQLESEEIDCSDLDSEGDVKEYQLGDTDPGNSTADVHYNPTNATHEALIDALLAKTVHEFKATIANTGKAWIWKGRVKVFKPELERNTPVVAPLEIRNTGLPTRI